MWNLGILQGRKGQQQWRLSGILSMSKRQTFNGHMELARMLVDSGEYYPYVINVEKRNRKEENTHKGAALC